MTKRPVVVALVALMTLVVAASAHASPDGSGAASVDVRTLDPPTSLAAAAWECVDAGAAGGRDAPPPATGWQPTRVPTPRDAGVCTSANAWLRVHVRVPESVRAAQVPLGVSIGEVHGAYEVFADGKKIGGLGDIGSGSPGAHDVVDAVREGAAFAIPHEHVEDGDLEILVHVVRDGEVLETVLDRRLVNDGPTAIGAMPGAHDRAEAEVSARVKDEIAVSLGCTALFLFIALYHVLVWVFRRDLLGYLWFGVFAFVADAWGTLVAIQGTPVLPITARTGAIYGNFVGSLVNAAFIEFFAWYLLKHAPPRRLRIYQVLLLAVSLVGFIPVYGVGWTTSPVVILVKVAMPFWILVEIVRLLRRSREARVLLTGMILAAAGAPLEAITRTRGIHLPISPGQAALLVFFVTMAVALVAQFARTLDDVDARAKELADTNVSIQRFVPFAFLRALSRESVREVKRGDSTSTTLSVMFCDLRGFTTLAEKMGPQETFQFINDYLEKMEPEIHKTGGFINQYLGDGIMALFPAGADAAVDAAVGMSRALEALNATRVAKGEPPLRIGIGIHTGGVMMGTIGGGDQLDSGVVGDVVNTAARLEGITKMYGAVVLISGATMTALQDPAARNLRPLDAVKAKGKTEPLSLIEVVDADPRPLREAKLASRGELEAALALYRKGKFDDASVRFGALAARVPKDGAARAFAERCRAFTHAPPDAWDGVFSLTTK